MGSKTTKLILLDSLLQEMYLLYKCFIIKVLIFSVMASRTGDVGDLVRMPGTNWCGHAQRKNTAFSSLGSYSTEDRCCRQHDLGCPYAIFAGQNKYGLHNKRPQAIMHCSCDERFRSCLKMTNTHAADIIGNMFFNIAKTPCFTLRLQKVCDVKHWWGSCQKFSKKKKMIAKKRKATSY